MGECRSSGLIGDPEVREHLGSFCRCLGLGRGDWSVVAEQCPPLRLTRSRFLRSEGVRVGIGRIEVGSDACITIGRSDCLEEQDPPW